MHHRARKERRLIIFWGLPFDPFPFFSSLFICEPHFIPFTCICNYPHSIQFSRGCANFQFSVKHFLTNKNRERVKPKKNAPPPKKKKKKKSHFSSCIQGGTVLRQNYHCHCSNLQQFNFYQDNSKRHEIRTINFVLRAIDEPILDHYPLTPSL